MPQEFFRWMNCLRRNWKVPDWSGIWKWRPRWRAKAIRNYSKRCGFRFWKNPHRFAYFPASFPILPPVKLFTEGIISKAGRVCLDAFITFGTRSIDFGLRLNLSAASTQALYGHVENRHKRNGKQSGGDHSAKNHGPYGLLTGGAGPSGDQEGDHSQDEGERGHHNGTKPPARRLHRGPCR